MERKDYTYVSKATNVIGSVLYKEDIPAIEDAKKA